MMSSPQPHVSEVQPAATHAFDRARAALFPVISDAFVSGGWLPVRDLVWLITEYARFVGVVHTISTGLSSPNNLCPIIESSNEMMIVDTGAMKLQRLAIDTGGYCE